MAMQFYASPEQIMRDRSELARKGIARGRSAVVLSYADGVLFVAENLSSALHKVSEIYDRIGFAAVGRYNEFENLRRFGVRTADLNGLAYDRRDVTGRALANAFAQILGTIFTEQSKPFEVEICVAQVGASAEDDELYRLTYDGSVNDEPGRMAMGGQAEAITGVLKERHRPDMSLAEAVTVAVQALGSVGGEGGAARTIAAEQLEVAVLDRRRVGRTFRRVTGAALTALLAGDAAPAEAPTADEKPTTPTREAGKPTTSAGSADLEGPQGETPQK
ncbi:proteasome subunit alpha [Micromonospora rosaria]|uniref:Proteasome subunit alpha n=1 Tax=Micromonospora rosaria TaxID=47874 RepID=A0A136PR12_9ACTN|nr:proteasome subunit alpha [Micromonospora rosaria]KXK60892.1 proteasome subunit alpha [Micromonospora rosaria]